MAAALSQGGVIGTEIFAGARKAVITAAEANQLKATKGKVASIVVWGDTAGTTCTLDVYDDPTTTNNKVWRWATANGVGVYALQMPMANGIRVVAAGTLPTNGGFTVIYT